MTSKYERFIYLLKKEFQTGKMIANETPKDLCEDETFRRWRHEVSELFRKINKDGYSEVCRIDERNFGESADCNDPKKTFRLDVKDTLAEMDTVQREARFSTPEPTRIIKAINLDEKNSSYLKKTFKDIINESPYYFLVGVFIAGFWAGVAAYDFAIKYTSFRYKEICLKSEDEKVKSKKVIRPSDRKGQTQ